MAGQGSEATDAQRRTLVVVPTFNERDNILQVVASLLESTQADVLVVDDSSPDGTRDVVEPLVVSNDRVHLLVRPHKMGLGSAYIAGFGWGGARGYEILCEMDADLSHDPAQIPRLVEALKDADLVIGSRYVPGGGVANWGLTRRLLSRYANVYVRLWLRLGVRDATSGFRAFRTETVQALDISTMRSEGYGFQIEMTRRLVRSGRRVTEVPISFVERAGGDSKMSSRIVLEALINVTVWGFRDSLRLIRERM
ncbi:MAG: glycosyltransferase [Actinobacteria bacterium]|nr:glycosyltransferase [Actinomycetota bacterium]